ncbi:uncharacterized protein LOC130402641 [Gadus chalcogrammus]|uniref:uncharacterized protein LOC130402641 n=1 Tax=Gadus chalcogrammus TaxID=1042646 RepID=UPI0024C49758|nr:uncharacterized protein LOC130402641 [Gadus chalcogrammus]
MDKLFDLDLRDPRTEGRHLAVGLMHDQFLAEAMEAAENVNRARSGGDSPRSSTKRSGRGKARGRRGGRGGRAGHTGRADRWSGLTTGMDTEVLALPSEDSLPLPRAQQNPQEMFGAESAFRSSGFVGPATCITTANGHSTTGTAWWMASLKPSTCISRGETGIYATHEQDRILPTMPAQHCTCQVPSFTVEAGKPVILITINGRYDLHLPRYVCQTCLQQWAPDVRDLVRSGYWPASANASTIYTVDLNTFQELKLISPGFSRQALAKMLEHRTLCAGRSGQINGDALQRSFLEFAYASFEKDQLCCDTPFTCPACTPEMVAVSADGNRKRYRFGHTGRSNDTPFFDGLFLAKDSEVSDFVNTIQMAVKNIKGRGTCGDSQRGSSKGDL